MRVYRPLRSTVVCIALVLAFALGGRGYSAEADRRSQLVRLWMLPISGRLQAEIVNQHRFWVFAEKPEKKHWYFAVPVKKQDDRYLVRYVDGAEEWLTPDRMRFETLQQGDDNLQCNHRGRGKYYPCKIRLALGKYLFEVEYANGTRELTTLRRLALEASLTTKPESSRQLDALLQPKQETDSAAHDESARKAREAEIKRRAAVFFSQPTRENYLALREQVMQYPRYHPYFNATFDMERAVQQRDNATCIKLYRQDFPALVLSPKAHRLAAQAAGAKGDSSLAAQCQKLHSACISAITTGSDGTVDKPYVITYVDDEDELCAALGRKMKTVSCFDVFDHVRFQDGGAVLVDVQPLRRWESQHSEFDDQVALGGRGVPGNLSAGAVNTWSDGMIAYFQQDFATAERKFGELIELYPNWENMRFSRASVRFVVKNHEGALEDVQQILRINPGYFFLRQYYALFLWHCGSGDQNRAEGMAGTAFRHALWRGFDQAPRKFLEPAVDKALEMEGIKPDSHPDPSVVQKNRRKRQQRERFGPLSNGRSAYHQGPVARTTTRKPVQAATKAPALISGGSLDEARALLERFLQHDADQRALTRMIIPRSDDYQAVFKRDFAVKAKAHYEQMFSDPNSSIAPRPNQTQLLIWQATTEELRAGVGDADNFPGGYSEIASKLRPGLIWYRFKFVEQGETTGMAFDGLTFLNGHWAIFPKPYRVE